MFTEIVKLVPAVDRSALSTMFRTLSQRFSQVTKKFGAGMKTAMKFSVGGALGGALISKLLNPLQKAEEVIDRLLAKGDDAVTDSEEFETTPGNLLRLQGLATAKGMDAETLRTLLGKFQGALSEEKEAAKDPKAKAGLLRAFVGETDIAEAFFKVIQSMQNMDPSQRVVAQNQIFGERIRGRASEFFNAKDFGGVLSALPGSEALTLAAESLAKLSDAKDLDTAKRNALDVLTKAGLLNSTHITGTNISENKKLASENQDLLRYNSLKNASNELDKLTYAFDKLATTLTNDLLPLVTKSIEGWNILTKDVFPAIPNVVKDVGKNYTDTMMPYRQWEADSIATLTTTIQNVWSEFKSSRFYKMFGGGKP